MNMLSLPDSYHVPEASYFPTLKIANEFMVQGTTVYFSLIVPKTGIYVAGVLEADEVGDSVACEDPSKPEYGQDVPYTKLQAKVYHLAKVEDFCDVIAMQGQQFLLTEQQVSDLNGMLDEHFEEEKVMELAV